MIWDGYRDESWSFVRVSWPDMVEGEELDWVTGGDIESSCFTTLKSSGSLEYEGEEAPDTSGLVRVYYHVTDEAGETQTVALGTFFMTGGAASHSGALKSGKVNLVSVLQVPSSDCYGRYYTVSAGTNIVAKANEILKSLGLTTNEPSGSYVIQRDLVYKPEDTYLTIVNDLLSSAGYATCMPDGYGTVLIQPTMTVTEREAEWAFADGERSIMVPSVEVSDNRADTPNVCRYTYETEEESLWAAAYNDDPTHAASRPNRGYAVALTESVSELSGETQAERIEELRSKAETKLIDNSSLIEYVEWQHPWVPIEIYSGVTVDYLEAGLSWAGSVTNVKVPLGGHAEVTTRARKYVSAGFSVTTEGGSW